MKVKEILSALDRDFALENAEKWDNVGLLVGDADATTEKIIVCHDLTRDVIRRAVVSGCQVIVSYHPLIFKPMPNVTAQGYEGALVAELIKNGLSLISVHTALDHAPNGTRPRLASVLEIEEWSDLGGYGLFGKTACSTEKLELFLPKIAKKLNADGLKYYDAGLPVRVIGAGGGSCGELIEDAKAAGCDTFVTGDLKHSRFMAAAGLGINLIDAGHFETEFFAADIIADALRVEYPNADIEVCTAGSTVGIWRK